MTETQVQNSEVKEVAPQVEAQVNEVKEMQQTSRAGDEPALESDAS